MLYNTFLLRTWVTVTNESACRDEYLELLDHLHSNYLSSFEVTDSSKELINFLINLEFVQSHQHLLHLSSCVACVPPPLALIILQSPWGKLTLRDIRADSLMSSCHVKVTSHLSLVPLLFAAMIPILAASLSCLPLSVSRLSPAHMTLGPTWMLLGEERSISLSCPTIVPLCPSHWIWPASPLVMMYPPWSTLLLSDSPVKGSGGKWSGLLPARELP